MVQEASGELLVYDTDANRAHSLNETAAAVWRSADGTRSVAEIAAELPPVDVTDPSRSEAVVWLALEQLSENGLMQSSVAWADPAQSRRELIRRIGLLSAAALPLVASLAVPSPAFAGGSCACVNPGDCLTQTTCPSTANCNSGQCAP